MSVHGIQFLRELHSPSHLCLHPHFMMCNTASGAGGFKQQTGEKWLEPKLNAVVLGSYFDQFFSKSWICSVPDECVSPVNQKFVGGFFLRLHNLSRRTNGADNKLCAIIDSQTVQYKQSVCFFWLLVRNESGISILLFVCSTCHHQFFILSLEILLWRTTLSAKYSVSSPFVQASVRRSFSIIQDQNVVFHMVICFFCPFCPRLFFE